MPAANDASRFIFKDQTLSVMHIIHMSFSRQQLQRQAPALCALRLLKTSPVTHSDAIATPPLDGAPKQYSPKIQQLVNDIASLTLLEVSDLNELLKVCGEKSQNIEY